MTHHHSIKAYYEELDKFPTRRTQIMLLFLGSGKAWTDRGVMAQLGFAERNQVQPRITELIKAGSLQETGSVKCEITGKKVRLVGLPQGQMEMSL